MEPISSEFAKLRQSLQLRRLYNVDGHKIRTTVYVDAYDFQSYARAERWNGERWYEMATIAHPAMHSVKKVSRFGKVDADAEAAMNVDTQELLKAVKAILD